MWTPTGNLLKDIDLALARDPEGLIVFSAEPRPDVFVTDLFKDADSRIEVDPESFWGVARFTAEKLRALNEAIRFGTADAINAACLRVQEGLGDSTGILPDMHLSRSEVHEQISMFLCGHALAEMKAKLEPTDVPIGRRSFELPLRLSLSVHDSEGVVVDKTTAEMKLSEIETVVDHAVRLIELHRQGQAEAFDEVVEELDLALTMAGVLESEDLAFLEALPFMEAPAVEKDLAQQAIESRGGPELYIDAYANSDTGDSPVYARVMLDPSFIDELDRLQGLCVSHGLSEVRVTGSPDRWGSSQEEESWFLRLPELVVSATGFRFVDHPRDANHSIETRSQDIDALRDLVAAKTKIHDLTPVFLGADPAQLKATVAEFESGSPSPDDDDVPFFARAFVVFVRLNEEAIDSLALANPNIRESAHYKMVDAMKDDMSASAANGGGDSERDQEAAISDAESWVADNWSNEGSHADAAMALYLYGADAESFLARNRSRDKFSGNPAA